MFLFCLLQDNKILVELRSTVCVGAGRGLVGDIWGCPVSVGSRFWWIRLWQHLSKVKYLPTNSPFTGRLGSQPCSVLTLGHVQMKLNIKSLCFLEQSK